MFFIDDSNSLYLMKRSHSQNEEFDLKKAKTDANDIEVELSEKLSTSAIDITKTQYKIGIESDWQRK